MALLSPGCALAGKLHFRETREGRFRAVSASGGLPRSADVRLARGSGPDPVARAASSLVAGEREGAGLLTWRRHSVSAFSGRGAGDRWAKGRIGATATDEAATAAGELDPRELVAQVLATLDSEHSDLPLGTYGRDDEAMILWFLRDRKFDVEAAVRKLSKAIRWRHEFGVASLRPEDVADEALTGKAYLHDSPALDGRPVIVVAAAKHFPNAERLLSSQQLCVFLIEQALTQLPPGEEKFLGIFDLRGFNARNADLSFVGFLIQVFFNYYPKRLHKVLFVDAPPIFQPGWRVMKPMLKSYASLVEFCSAQDVREKYFAPGKAPPSFQEDA